DGGIAFRLGGMKRDQLIWDPRGRGLRYHVEIYFSFKGRATITVTDMWTSEAIFDWHEGSGDYEALFEAARRLPGLAEALRRERVLEVV
ncbi:MAG: hypothetical protein BA066_06675, partial [Candidatus Korarchaeota archaeon NZ13-K]